LFSISHNAALLLISDFLQQEKFDQSLAKSENHTIFDPLALPGLLMNVKYMSKISLLEMQHYVQTILELIPSCWGFLPLLSKSKCFLPLIIFLYKQWSNLQNYLPFTTCFTFPVFIISLELIKTMKAFPAD